MSSAVASTTPSTLKAPFPAFGGKSRVAPVVWSRLGNPRNYVEPFAFSAAMLLKRPGGAGPVETINDRNAFVANFWRAVQHDPDAVAHHADWPVNETDLHARHRWLVNSDKASAVLNEVREDPDAFDARIAGWWCWGACCWIGSGWCDETHRNSGSESRPDIEGQMVTACESGRRNERRGITGSPTKAQLPDLGGDGSSGRGVHSPSGNDLTQKRAKLTGNGQCGVAAQGDAPHTQDGKRARLAAFNSAGTGVCNGPNERQPALGQAGWGINVGGEEQGGRPQLADAFARGRGVNGNDHVSLCDARREWITGWMRALADRLRPVRVCCGHWSRICDSDSTMTRLGATGVFLDPPYRMSLKCGKKNRSAHIYANDRVQDVNALCDEVQEWCLKWGGNKDVRIALCGLEGEYPEVEAAGWEVHAWKSNGGYGNRSAARGENENAARERIWFSPHCENVSAGGLFG